MSISISYFPILSNHFLSIENSPPAITGVLNNKEQQRNNNKYCCYTAVVIIILLFNYVLSFTCMECEFTVVSMPIHDLITNYNYWKSLIQCAKIVHLVSNSLRLVDSSDY